MDGSTTSRTISWAFDFDRALLAPSGLRILYAVLGTKGLVATARHQVRELNRSYYHAGAYEYPIAIGLLSDGTEVLAHCPDGYNRLTIETLSDGERLSSAGNQATDVFHSRLQFSPSGRYLLSAGWVWHPVEIVTVYDMERALADDTYLEGRSLDSQPEVNGEVDGACWLDAETLVVSTNPDGI